MHWHIAYARFESTANATISCKILVKIGQVVSEGNKITDGNYVACSRRVRRILSSISGYTLPIFAIFSPFESVLRADDGSVHYFWIFQGTLPWQPNNLEQWGELILRVFFARSPDVSTFSFCYYLLVGDTASLSDLVARLCHTFLVSLYLWYFWWLKSIIIWHRYDVSAISVLVSVRHTHA